VSGFIDFLVGLLLLTGVSLQSTYLPHTVSSCDSASTWNVEGQANVTNLFTWIGDIDGIAPEDACQEFMATWVMGMVLGCVLAPNSSEIDYSHLLSGFCPYLPAI